MAWRRLEPPVRVRAFIGEQWHDAVADAYDAETRELRVRWPPTGAAEADDGAPTGLADFHAHRVLEPSLYEAFPDQPLPA